MRVISFRTWLKEDWSAEYKRSINCNRPKGFSQRAHCQGRKKQEMVESSSVDAGWMRKIDSFLDSVKMSPLHSNHSKVKGKDVHFIVIDYGSKTIPTKNSPFRFMSEEWHGFVEDKSGAVEKVIHFHCTYSASPSRGGWSNPFVEMGNRQLMRSVWEKLADKKEVVWRKTVRIK